MPTRKSSIERLTLHLPDHVRHIEIAAVGNRCRQVGNLQRRRIDLALPDGDGDDGQSVPRALIGTVVELSIGYQTTLLAWQVNAQSVAETHRDHIVTPRVHGLLDRTVFRAIANHVV